MCMKIIALGSPKHHIKLSHSPRREEIDWLLSCFDSGGDWDINFDIVKTLNSEIWRREAHCSPISTLFWSESIKLFTIYEVRINHKACAMTSWLLTARSCNRRSDEICALKSADFPTPSCSRFDTWIVQLIVRFTPAASVHKFLFSIQVFIFNLEKCLRN